jgi:hypothetical protein
MLKLNHAATRAKISLAAMAAVAILETMAARTSATNPIGKKTRVNRDFAACQAEALSWKPDELRPGPITHGSVGSQG